MSSWRKAMVFLGLGPDEEYDDYAALPDDRVAPQAAVAPQAPARPAPPRPTGTVRARPAEPAESVVLSTPPPSGGEPSSVRTIQLDDATKPRVRAVPRQASVRPQLVSPTQFNQAQEVADNFKAGRPVAMDLIDADRDLARRLIDFSSGICYALGGSMEKIGSTVYLLTPTGASVTPEERARLANAHDEDL